MSLWVHTLVQNEDRYIWFAVTSVIEYVDKILIWDTGSTDRTVEIIKEIEKKWPEKVEFREIGAVTPEEFTRARQEMLRATKGDWLFILDGDEVWWDEEIKKIREIVYKTAGKYDSLVSKYINLVGDIFHYQPETAGKYMIKNLEGFVTIRAMNLKNIKDIKIDKPHGRQGFYDSENVLVQDRDAEKMLILEKPSFIHFTNLPRSGMREDDLKVPKRGFKFKHELGLTFPMDYYYPEALFRPKPDIVEGPWEVRSKEYVLRSTLETPLKKMKRQLIKGKSGY